MGNYFEYETNLWAILRLLLSFILFKTNSIYKTNFVMKIMIYHILPNILFKGDLILINISHNNNFCFLKNIKEDSVSVSVGELWGIRKFCGFLNGFVWVGLILI